MKLYHLNLLPLKKIQYLYDGFKLSFLEQGHSTTDDINSADAIYFEIGNLNFFGGIVPEPIIIQLDLLKNFTGQVYAFMDDPELSCGYDINKFIKTFKAKNWPATSQPAVDHIIELMTNNFAGYITEEGFRLNEWTKTIEPDMVKIFLKGGWFIANTMIPVQPPPSFKFYDLCYLGTKKESRVKQLKEYIIPNTIIGGKMIELVDSDHKKLKCSVEESCNIRNQSLATLCICSKYHNDTVAILRICESLFSDAITLITPDFDPNNKVITHKFREQVIVSSREQVQELLKNESLVREIKDAETEQANLMRAYCNSFIT